MISADGPRAKELWFERDVDCSGFWLMLDAEASAFVPDELVVSLRDAVVSLMDLLKVIEND